MSDPRHSLLILFLVAGALNDRIFELVKHLGKSNIVYLGVHRPQLLSLLKNLSVELILVVLGNCWRLLAHHKLDVSKPFFVFFQANSVLLWQLLLVFLKF